MLLPTIARAASERRHHSMRRMTQLNADRRYRHRSLRSAVYPRLATVNNRNADSERFRRSMLGRVGVVMLFVGSACAHADIINLSCAQTGETEYKLSYSFTASTHRVQIFASTNADPTAAMPRLVKTADTAVTVHAGRPRQRIYFFLKADTGEMREVSIRALPLEGATNFRDLGGYETGDGRFVRWGLLYRSAVLTKLTSSDMDYLRPLGIRVVCDFRRKRETDAAPEIWDPDV